MNLRAIGKKQQFGEIVEDDSDRFITERVSEPVLVGIVYPLAHPDHGSDPRIFGLVLHDGSNARGWIGCDHSRQLLAQLG